MHLLEVKNAKPLKMARNEVLGRRRKTFGHQEAPVQRIMEYFVREFLDEKRSYALGPVIMSLACEAVGGEPETTVPTAAAVILIGSGAEIHDDIIDMSKTKNSRLTVFGKFGHSRALIAGNVLFAKGFALLYEKSIDKTDAKKTASVVEIIKNAIVEHANAECLALKFKGNLGIAPEKYMAVIRMRSSIIEAQARIGGLIGGGAVKEIKALRKYGRILGTLSLVRGEFVDVFETAELHHRLMNECLPLPILLALQSAKEKDRIIDVLKKEKPTRKDKAALVQAMFETETVEKLKKEMVEMAQEANRAVARLKPEPMSSLQLLTQLSIKDL